MPEYIPGKTPNLEILQISIKDKIFIIFLKKIKNIYEKLDKIWGDFKIIKLGLGFKEDLKNLISTFDKKEIILRNYIDIKNIYQDISGKNKNGLSDISKDIFS